LIPYHFPQGQLIVGIFTFNGMKHKHFLQTLYLLSNVQDLQIAARLAAIVLGSGAHSK
jgi:hypothetical protein